MAENEGNAEAINEEADLGGTYVTDDPQPSGDTPAPDSPDARDGEGFINTMDDPTIDLDTDPGAANNTQSDSQEDPVIEETAEAEAKEDSGDKKPRLDRDARFSEVIQQNKDLTERLAAAEKAPAPKVDMSELSQLLTPRVDVTREELPAVTFRDMSVMSDDDLREWSDRAPGEYARNLARQTHWETTRDNILREKQRSVQGRVESSLREYAATNTDFVGMVEDGTLKDFIQSHPGHNFISAHQVLTAETRSKTFETRIAEERAAAKKEAEAEFNRNLRAKQRVTPLTGGGSGGVSRSPVTDPALSDTKKHGGRNAVIARRYEERRRAANSA